MDEMMGKAGLTLHSTLMDILSLLGPDGLLAEDAVISHCGVSERVCIVVAHGRMAHHISECINEMIGDLATTFPDFVAESISVLPEEDPNDPHRQ